MSLFWWGVAAFAAVSFVVNLFDSDFRTAIGRALLGLFGLPFFGAALLLDRYFPAARYFSNESLRRFSSTEPRTRGWGWAYRQWGVLVVRRPKG